jgi:hypothetical protein
MATLFDIFKYNNIPYSELTDNTEKQEIEKLVTKLSGTELEKSILIYVKYNPYCDICLRCDNMSITSNLPQDMFNRLAPYLD